MTDKVAALLASHLGAGDRERIVCPKCKGGSSKEPSFVIGKLPSGKTVYKCYRASCGYSGAERGLAKPRVKHKAVQANPYRGPLMSLDKDQEEFLEGRIGWGAAERALGRPLWAPEVGRYAFPINTPQGRVRGYVLRSYDPGQGAKAWTRMTKADEPCASYYRQFSEDSVLLVEDIPSAVRAAQYTNVVALLGVGNMAIMEEIKEAGFKKVTWALDADAYSTSLKKHARFKHFFDSSAVIKLKKDLKDMTPKEVYLVLKDVGE